MPVPLHAWISIPQEERAMRLACLNLNTRRPKLSDDDLFQEACLKMSGAAARHPLEHDGSPLLLEFPQWRKYARKAILSVVLSPLPNRLYSRKEVAVSSLPASDATDGVEHNDPPEHSLFIDRSIPTHNRRALAKLDRVIEILEPDDRRMARLMFEHWNYHTNEPHWKNLATILGRPLTSVWRHGKEILNVKIRQGGAKLMAAEPNNFDLHELEALTQSPDPEDINVRG